MPSSIVDVLRADVRYHAWANEQMWLAVLLLPNSELVKPRGTSFDSLLKTLQHMFAADRVWLSRLQNQSNLQLNEIEASQELSVLKLEWDSTLKVLTELTKGLTDESAQSACVYRNSTGAEFATPIWQVVMHLVNHGTGHRGQVNGIIRQSGGQPRNTDLIYFFRMHPQLS